MLMRILALLSALAGLALGPVRAESELWPATPQVAPQGDIPGAFDYYTLVLSWSPTHCITTERGIDDAQCARADGARFGFVLHGLWPQYEQGYPGRCRTRWRPFVPDQVIDSMRDVMPSRGLIIHEYREHGTCSGLRPDGYFALARRLFERITIPKRYRNPFETQLVSPREVMADFLRANPALRPDMIAITCEGPGGRLRDVRICLTKDGLPRPCSINERRGGSCRAASMHVPPVRSTKWDYEKDRLPPLKPPPGSGQRAPEVPRPR